MKTVMADLTTIAALGRGRAARKAGGMRRLIVGGFVTSAIVLGTAVTGGAIPTKGETLVLTCGDASVTVETSPGGGVASWDTDGAMYHLKTFELRIYRGEFATEPDTEPLLEFSQSYGNRNGQGEATECTFRDYNPDHNATAFEYVSVTSKS